MDDEKEILQHFDKIFGTNTIKHIKLNMPLLRYFFYNLEEDFRKPSPKFKELRKKQIELSEKIHKTFNTEQEKLFDEYSNTTNMLVTVEDLQLFCFGYIFAKELEKEGKIEQE